MIYYGKSDRLLDFFLLLVYTSIRFRTRALMLNEGMD